MTQNLDTYAFFVYNSTFYTATQLQDSNHMD